MSFKDRLQPYFQTRPRDPATGRPTRRPATGQGNGSTVPSTPRPTAAAPAAAAIPATGIAQPAAPAQPAPHGGSPELVRRRDELARRLAELQWDLGGLTYEMAIRDHFRLDVLVRRAAELQSVDADLGAVEMLLRTEQAAAAGACPSCGALHSRGAVYCWQCGSGLMVQAAVAVDDVVRPSQSAASEPPSPPAGAGPG